MRNIIKYLAQKPKIVNIFVGLIIVLGVITLSGIRSNFLPPEPVSFINVSVVYRGASPDEVEEDVVNKIEDNLDGLKGIRRVTSTSKESFALVQVEILQDADVNEVLQDVNNAVDKITTFPNRMDTPVIEKQEILNYTMTFAVVGKVSLTTLKDYAKEIKDELLLKPTLSQIFLSGYPEEEIEISLRENDLQAYELTFEEVAQAVRATNTKSSGGDLKTGNRQILLRLDNRSYYANGLMNTVVKATPDGKRVLLKDVADIKNQFADKPEKSFINGKQAVIVKVFSRSNEDILNNAELVNQYIKEFNEENTSVQIEIIEDRSISLNEAIGRLKNNAWQGILLVLIILGLFLHPRVAFWVAFKIPVGLLGMFILSNFYDLTINQVSLFGTIVVLGIIVDDGVVVAENIYEHFQSGKSPLQSALDGTMEVVTAVISSLTTTALAFSLFFFLHGQLGDYFSDISFVVCGTLLVALLESLFFLPVHIARSKALQKDDKPWKLTQKTNGSLIWVRDKLYSKIANFAIKFPIIPAIVVVVCMFLTIMSVSGGIIQTTFFPNIDQDVINAKLELPLGTDESVVEAKLKEMEEAVWKVNEFYTNERDDEQSVIRYVERVLGPASNEGTLNIYMLEGNARGILSGKIADKIREEVGLIPQAINLAYGTLSAFGKPVSIALVGKNIEDLRKAKSMLREYLSNRSDLKDVIDTDKMGVPELHMQLSERAKYLGLSEGQVFNQVRQGFFGLEVQSLQRTDEEVKVWVRYAESDKRDVADLQNKQITTRNGGSRNGTFLLSEIATFEQERCRGGNQPPKWRARNSGGGRHCQSLCVSSHRFGRDRSDYSKKDFREIPTNPLHIGRRSETFGRNTSL